MHQDAVEGKHALQGFHKQQATNSMGFDAFTNSRQQQHGEAGQDTRQCCAAALRSRHNCMPCRHKRPTLSSGCVQGISNVSYLGARDKHVPLLRMAELHGVEEAPPTGQRRRHQPRLSQQQLGSFLASQHGQEGVQAS